MSGESVWRARAMAALAASVVSLAGIRVGQADTPASTQAVTSAPAAPAHPLNKDDLEAFFHAAISAIKVWPRPATRRISQIKYTVLGFACLFLSWFVVHWNVIGPIHRI
jgi:hypothetical protein